jgi:hypothetical protein
MESIQFRSEIYTVLQKNGLVYHQLYFMFFPLRDADEIETWMLEKLQLAQEENYKVKHFYFYTFLTIVLSLSLILCE